MIERLLLDWFFDGALLLITAVFCVFLARPVIAYYRWYLQLPRCQRCRARLMDDVYKCLTCGRFFCKDCVMEHAQEWATSNSGWVKEARR